MTITEIIEKLDSSLDKAWSAKQPVGSILSTIGAIDDEVSPDVADTVTFQLQSAWDDLDKAYERIDRCIEMLEREAE